MSAELGIHLSNNDKVVHYDAKEEENLILGVQMLHEGIEEWKRTHPGLALPAYGTSDWITGVVQTIFLKGSRKAWGYPYLFYQETPCRIVEAMELLEATRVKPLLRTEALTSMFRAQSTAAIPLAARGEVSISIHDSKRVLT